MAEQENQRPETLAELLATEIALLDREQLESLLNKLTKIVSEVNRVNHPEHENATRANEMIDKIRIRLDKLVEETSQK